MSCTQSLEFCLSSNSAFVQDMRFLAWVISPLHFCICCFLPNVDIDLRYWKMSVTAEMRQLWLTLPLVILSNLNDWVLWGKFCAVTSHVMAYVGKTPITRSNSSEGTVIWASTFSWLPKLFYSLCDRSGLWSASLLKQVLSRLPPNMGDTWSLLTVRKNLLRFAGLDFHFSYQEKKCGQCQNASMRQNVKICSTNDCRIQFLHKQTFC